MLQKYNADSSFSQVPPRTSQRAVRAYSPRQIAVLGRHMSDPALLQEHRQTLTGGAPFVRRGHDDRFPGRTNDDLFRAVGGSSLRSGIEMTPKDAELFDGVTLRSWGRDELARYRYDYQPSWFSDWLRRVVQDDIPDRRVSRSLVDFAWCFFNAERCEAMTMLTYEQFSSHFAIARSTVGEWLKLLRSARVIESAHTWARDEGKTAARRENHRRHARCYGANLYRLGSAVADEVRIAIREGKGNASFASGRTMEHAARRCGQNLRAAMRDDIAARRRDQWYRRQERTEGLSSSSICSPIIGLHRPLLPSGSSHPRNGGEDHNEVRPPDAAPMASPARTRSADLPGKPARVTDKAQGQQEDAGVSPAFKELLEESSSDFARRFLNSLNALAIFFVCMLFACGGLDGGPTRTREREQKSRSPRNSYLARTEPEYQTSHIARWRPGSRRSDREFERDPAAARDAVRGRRDAPIDPGRIATKVEPMKIAKGTIQAVSDTQSTLSALLTDAYRGDFVWELEHELIVNQVALEGADSAGLRCNLEIERVVVNKIAHKKVPGRIGPGTLEIRAKIVGFTRSKVPPVSADYPRLWIKIVVTGTEAAELTPDTAELENPTVPVDADGFPLQPTAVDEEGGAHRITDLPESGQA